MVGKFRLRLATQKGENIAKEHGYDKFPVDPFAIAASNDICVEAKPPEKKGMSGCIIFQDTFVAIIYSTEIRNSGFQRFTIAHELGHYFLDGHPDEIISAGGVHASTAGFNQGNLSIETEADHFAAGLLMPAKVSRSVLLDSRMGLAGVQYLANAADTSLTAAAIRASEISPYPMAIVVSEGNHVKYSFLSERFKELGQMRPLFHGDSLPSSITKEFNRDGRNIRESECICGITSLSTWFNGPDIQLDEEIIGLGKYGLTLTILSSEDVPFEPLEEEDEEKKLVEQWTPKFAYGR